MYLIEIITYTLEADFETVYRAIGHDKPDTRSSDRRLTSVLSEDEDRRLFELSTIILDMYQKYISNRWNLVLDRDRNAVQTAIMEPSRSLNINTDYLLDLISTYAELVVTF